MDGFPEEVSAENCLPSTSSDATIFKRPWPPKPLRKSKKQPNAKHIHQSNSFSPYCNTNNLDSSAYQIEPLDLRIPEKKKQNKNIQCLDFPSLEYSFIPKEKQQQIATINTNQSKQFLKSYEINKPSFNWNTFVNYGEMTIHPTTCDKKTVSSFTISKLSQKLFNKKTIPNKEEITESTKNKNEIGTTSFLLNSIPKNEEIKK